MLARTFVCSKVFIMQILICLTFVCLTSCKSKQQTKGSSNNNDLCQNQLEHQQAISFGENIFYTTKSFAIMAYYSQFSFISNNALIEDFILYKGLHFQKIVAPGPFSLDIYESFNKDTLWSLNDVPDFFVWYSKNNTNENNFLITDSSGMPLKADIKNLINNNEFVSFLIPKEKLNRNKTYYIYLKQSVSNDNKLSFIQPVKFVD